MKKLSAHKPAMLVEMKKIFMITTALFLLSALPGFTACNPDDGPAGTEIPASAPQPDPAPGPDPSPDPDPSSGNRLQLTIGSVSFTATLLDNAAASAFKALLPMTVRMDELHGNEKYYYLPERLPTAASNPGTIRTGDLMLFGSDCLVLFYQTFRTSYSYTPIGRLDDAANLANAVGRGGVTVKFELIR